MNQLLKLSWLKGVYFFKEYGIFKSFLCNSELHFMALNLMFTTYIINMKYPGKAMRPCNNVVTMSLQRHDILTTLYPRHRIRLFLDNICTFSFIWNSNKTKHNVEHLSNKQRERTDVKEVKQIHRHGTVLSKPLGETWFYGYPTLAFNPAKGFPTTIICFMI